MKKIIACVLLLALCLSLFAACGEEPAAPAVDKLASAKEYVFTMYRTTGDKTRADNAEKAVADFKRVSNVIISGESFPVEWTVAVTSGAEDGVKIVDNGNGTVTVDIDEKPAEELVFTVTATLSGEDKTETVSFTYYVPAVEVSEDGIVPATEIKTGVAYKYALTQATRGETLFFSGEMSGNYLATTEDITKAVDMFAEEAEGGYRIYFLKGEEKNYVEIYEYATGKAGVHITTEPTTVWAWNADLGVLVAHVADDDRYIGTYSTYNTMSASATSYIAGDNKAKIGISQFPSYLCTLKLSKTNATELKAGTAYKYALDQTNRGETLYFSGEMSGNYLATTQDFSKAVDMFVEEVEGGYQMYFLKGEEKNYVEIYEYATGKAGVHITTEPTTVWAWNADLGILIAHVADDDRYIGTYNTYNTMSASATSYITGDNQAKIGISQFPSYLCTVKIPTKTVTKLTAGTPYKYSLTQATRGETLFFTGAMSGNYLATTQNISEAVDMFVEEVEGGYRMYFLNGEEKNYVEIYEYAAGKAGLHITTEPTTVFTWNDDLSILIAHVADDDRYIGTYSTYNTMSASATSYITGDNQAKIGISQFPSYFVVIGF